ncbi:MAG: RlpA-like double-psi beta-barrel-protein domain-containing protein-containing protein [Linnemannia gamsii]|nr:MAG: RlpA-like double-psi beta-barrel-protein domain-containing protein-containing protein [Linnemannia gamsii]
MAPIPRLAATPLSIITGALFTAFSAPSSTPPTNGSNATLTGTNYIGSASFLNLTLLNTPSPSSSNSSSSSSSSSSSPVSSLVYYHSKNNTYTGCNKMPFTSSDNVVLMNPLQFGNVSSSNTTCGNWVQIQNRQNTDLSTLAQIVGVCDDCEYGSMDLSLGALNDLAPDLPFDDLTFSSTSDITLSDITDPDSSVSSTTIISSLDLLDITWSLSDPPASRNGTTTTPTSTATPTSTTTPTPTSTTAPTVPSTQFTGRATWYSDTHGQCEHDYSQSDMIVAVNQDQMGTGKDLCGKKVLLTKKGSDVQVVATVVDMCPKAYCKHGDLDLSQGAFKKFAGLGVGVMELQWSFI